MKTQGFKTRLGDLTYIKSQDGKPVKMESGEVIINKKSTKKNIEKLVEINNDSTVKSSKKVSNDGTKGGLLKGKPHYDKNGKPIGGIKVIVDNSKEIEVEGDEFVVNKEASRKHWKELSRINQSAGNGVAIAPPSGAFDEDPEDNYEHGGKIDFNPNHVPSKMIVNYAKNIKSKHPEIWKLGGNIFGNEAFENLLRVSNRGYWLDSEEWMYIKWRAYVARHAKDFRIEGVVAMLKWCDKVGKGWPYMKKIIEEKIEKIDSKKGWKHKTSKMKEGGSTLGRTPAPLKDRIKGSKFNEKGSASTSSKASDIKFDDKTILSIQRLIDEHNDKHPSKKITLSVAKAVVRRGMGAYSSSHRPTISGGKPNSRTAWGLARLKAFIYKAQTGKSKSGNYSQDNDLFEELGISVQKMAEGGLTPTKQNQEFKNSALFFGGFFTGIQKQGIGKSIIYNIFKTNPNLENILLYTQEDAIGFWEKVGGEIIKKGNDKNGIYRYFVKINRNSVPKFKDLKELKVSYKNLTTKKAEISKGEYVIKYGKDKIGFFFVDDLGTIKVDPKEIILNNNNIPNVSYKNGGEVDGLKPAIPTIIKESQFLRDEMIETIKQKRLDKGEEFTEFDREFLEIVLLSDLMKAIGNYLKPTDKIKDVKTNKDRTGITISTIIYRDGEGFPFYTDVIVAGGHNIQIAHYRYLVKTKIRKESNNPEYDKYKEKIKKLSKIERLNQDMRYLLQVKERYESEHQDFLRKQKLTNEEALKELIAEEKTKDGESYTEKTMNISWDEIVKRGADKNYDYSKEKFLKSTKEYLDGKVSSYKKRNESSLSNLKRIEKDIEKKQKQIDEATGNVKMADGGVVKFNKMIESEYLKTYKEDYDSIEKINSIVAMQYLQQIAIKNGFPVGMVEFVNESKNPKNHFQMTMYTYDVEKNQDVIIYTAPFVYVDDKHKVVQSKTKVELLNSDWETIKKDIRYKDGGSVDRNVELVSVDYLDSIRTQDKSPWNYDLEKSIEEKGVEEPVVIGFWAEYGYVALLDGHHRLDTAIELGIDKIPAIVIDKYDEPHGKVKLYRTPMYKENPKKPSDLGIYKDGGSVDAKDTVTLDIPLLIRTLELAREDIKSDAELHKMVERLLDLKNKPELTMDDYAYIADIEHKHLKPKMEVGGNIEIEKLIAKAHDNLTRKRGRKEYAPTSHELQEEIDRMIMEDQFGSNNI